MLTCFHISLFYISNYVCTVLYLYLTVIFLDTVTILLYLSSGIMISKHICDLIRFCGRGSRLLGKGGEDSEEMRDSKGLEDPAE